MNDRINQQLHRNLQEVFGEGDAAPGSAAIDELYTEGCVLDVGIRGKVNLEQDSGMKANTRSAMKPNNFRPIPESRSASPEWLRLR